MAERRLEEFPGHFINLLLGGQISLTKGPLCTNTLHNTKLFFYAARSPFRFPSYVIRDSHFHPIRNEKKM